MLVVELPLAIHRRISCGFAMLMCTMCTTHCSCRACARQASTAAFSALQKMLSAPCLPFAQTSFIGIWLCLFFHSEKTGRAKEEKAKKALTFFYICSIVLSRERDGRKTIPMVDLSHTSYQRLAAQPFFLY